MDSPAEFLAKVIREAVECDRPECLPDHHTRYVAENLEIAQGENNRRRNHAEA